MRQFKFRLEPLLRYREHLAEQSQLEVARIRSDILSCEDRIRRLEKVYAETTEELDQKVARGIDAKQYTHFVQYLSGVETSIESETVQKNKLLKRHEEKQQELHQRTKDKKVLEKLKHQRREDYYSQMLSRLQKESDDMILLRKARGVNP